jgi:signal transduction histidine kinase
MYFGLAMLVVVVVVLAASGLNGAFKFRELTKSIRARSRELPLTAELNRSVADLRVAYTQIFRPDDFWLFESPPLENRTRSLLEFIERMRYVRIALSDYHDQLVHHHPSDPRIADISSELSTVEAIDLRLDRIDGLMMNPDMAFDDRSVRCQLDEEIAQLQPLVGVLPGFLKSRMEAFSEQVRGQYYSWMFISAVFLAGAITLMTWLIVVFRRSIFQPLETLIEGSRRVAGGDYRYRIQTHCASELGELATAFNEMTGRFYEIKTDLDEQVRLRTQEIVRKEQLASVGFLAAGVAHEINNPLAAIAWSAESLETRLPEILRLGEPSLAESEGVLEMKRYLQRIQSEAFRCKDITAALLDFSRLGDRRKTPADIGQLLEGIVEMVRPLGKYQGRTIRLDCQAGVIAQVNPQEMKQVALNLIANALDSVQDGGEVHVRLRRDPRQFTLIVEDNGCGMDAEVLQHLFEPFFTRRADGQGTGLGLSITYRIIEEHGGTIRAHSDGAGRGARFTVHIPLKCHEQNPRRLAAA